MTHECPTCGYLIPSTRTLKYDDATGIVTVKGHAAQLTKTEGKLFAALLATYPRPMERYDILEAIYTTEADWPIDKIVDVFVLKINKKLKGCGWHLQCLYQRGFCLVNTEYRTREERYGHDF